MQYNSYIVSETKTAFSIPMQTPIIKKNLKQKAFTLAETLITLSIIGVVAAITIPNLTHDAKKREHVARLKKAYTVISNAVQMIPAAAGCGDDYVCSGFVDVDTYNNGNEYYRYTDNAIDLLADQVKGKLHQNCSKILPYHQFREMKCVTTEDGMVIYGLSNGERSFIAVDTNGNKGPNKTNYDIWAFGFKKVYTTGHGQFPRELLENTTSVIIPHGAVSDIYAGKLGAECNEEFFIYNGTEPWNAYCTNYVLKTGKMDY